MDYKDKIIKNLVAETQDLKALLQKLSNELIEQKNKTYKNLCIDKVYRKLCKVDEFENFMDLFQQTTYITEYWINYDYILELKIEYMFTPEELEALKNDKIDYISITLDY